MPNSLRSKPPYGLNQPLTLAFFRSGHRRVLVIDLQQARTVLRLMKERPTDVPRKLRECLLASRPEDDELRLDLVRC